MSELVTYDLTDGVATITMDDGRANAMAPELIDEVLSALDQAESDGAVVVLRGREGKFSAGFDLGVLQSGDGARATRMLRGGGELVSRLVSFPQSVLAACTGHGIAYGTFLLMACDVRISVEGAYKYGANESALGLPVPRYAVALCRHRMPATGFHRALVTGPVVGQAEALAWGILDEVVAESDWEARVAEEAARLATLVPDAVRANRALVIGDLADRMRQLTDEEFPAA